MEVAPQEYKSNGHVYWNAEPPEGRGWWRKVGCEAVGRGGARMQIKCACILKHTAATENEM